MYYIDNKYYDIQKLRPSEGAHTMPHRTLSGFEAKIHLTWKTVLDKTEYSDEDGNVKYKRVKFRCPHIAPLTKHQGGAFPRSVTIRDDTGTHRVVWCDNAMPQPNGGFRYSPADFVYKKGMFDLDPQVDIEEILWHLCFSPLRNQKTTIKVGDKSVDVSKLYMIDSEKDAKTYLAEQSKSAEALFYLTRSQMHYTDEKLINFLCNMYDITRPETLSNSVKRERLLKAVTEADKREDKERNSEFFVDSLNGYISGDEFTQMRALVSKAHDRQLIGFDSQSHKVFLKGANNTQLDKWYTVPMSETPRWMKAFSQWLLGHPEKVEILKSGIDERPIEKKPPRTFYIPTPLTEDYFSLPEKDGGMKWGDMKALTNLIPNINTELTNTKLTREKAAAILISYFITEGKTINPDWIRDTPEPAD